MGLFRTRLGFSLVKGRWWGGGRRSRFYLELGGVLLEVSWVVFCKDKFFVVGEIFGGYLEFGEEYVFYVWYAGIEVRFMCFRIVGLVDGYCLFLGVY